METREIKFRGLPTIGRYNLEHYPELKEGDWVYGYYVKSRGGHYILQDYNESGYDDRWETSEWVEVIPETVGQYIGLPDKNGKEIYEGDIIRFHYFFASLGEGLGVEESEHELTGVLKWGNYGWAVPAIKGEHWQGYTGYSDEEGESGIVDLMGMNESSIHEESFEVIGSIYENKNN